MIIYGSWMYLVLLLSRKKNIMLSAYCRRPRSVCFHFDFRWGGNEGATVADRLLDADTKSGRLLSFGQRPENKQRPSVTGDTITFHLDFFYFFFQQSTAAILGGRTKFPFDFLVCFLLDSVDHQGRFLSINRQVDALRARNRLTVEEFSIEKKKKICKLAGAV